MTDATLGKVDRAFFDEYIYPNLGADREDVALEPEHGVDFGVVEVGDQVLAMATDPISILPPLGFERAAWLAFHILFSDVAISGLEPAHLSIDFNLPPEMTDEEFETVWNTFDREARNLGVSVVTGHTARYASANYPMVGGATTIAVGDRADLITPNGAEPGDRVIVTKGPAVEAVGILSTLFEPLMDDVPASVISDAQNRFYEMSPIEDALVAADAGPVTAMHDATEGGVYGGLFEMARAGDVGIEIETAPIPVRPGVREACEFFDIDPWISISEGTLLLTVDPTGVEDVLDALDDADVPAADAGRVVEGSGLVVDGEAVAHPGEDPYWATVEEYMQKLEAL